MGLFEFVKGELIDVIEWLDDSNDTMVYRFERKDNEIKYGARLIVREGQIAAFVNKGRIADVFRPGTYSLETKNLPVLTKIMHWYRGFNSPFKAEVYFLSSRQFTDYKWGTKNPVMLRDPEFGPLQIRAFGTYAFKIVNAPNFIREIVGTDGQFTTNEIMNHLRDIITTRASDGIAEAKIPVLDMAANYDELGDKVLEKIAPEFDQYGLQLMKLLVENISLPDAVQEALDKRASMNIIGNMNQYTQFQAANAMEDAAKNPGTAGGMMGGGMGMGMGFAMANQMGQTQAQSQQSPTTPPPPPPTTGMQYYISKNGSQEGPIDIHTLSQKISAGEVNQNTYIWKQGMSGWTLASQVSELSNLFVPPPPPPPAP